LKPVTTQTVRATLAVAWNFAAPIAVETLAPNKFLLGISHADQLNRILHHGPWNIRGSLLLLQPWSPGLALAEVKLTQVHGLPRHNMTPRNAIMIGKGLGSLLEVENLDTAGLICRQFLRIKVDINTALPLNPGFHLPRPGREPFWISFRYERLGDYCTICGLIGHKRPNCPSPPQNVPHVLYNIPLQAAASPVPRLVFPRDDSDSGLSSEGSALSRSEVTSGSSFGGESSHLQLVPRLSQTDMVCHVSSPQELSFQSSIDSTQVKETVLHHLYPKISDGNEPLLATSEISRNVQAARDKSKGKAPIVYTHKPKKLIASDIICPKLYGSTPSLLDSTITQIQDISGKPDPSQQAHFTDFLSSWAHHKPNPSQAEHPSPKPFQLYPPLQVIALPPDNPAQLHYNSQINIRPSTTDHDPTPIAIQTSHPSNQPVEFLSQFPSSTTSITSPSSTCPPAINPYT
jgi:hypothetical protein